MAVVKANYRRSPADYEKYAVIAVTSIYGIDILQDNVEACRERLFDIWNEEYTANCKKEANDECRETVRFILVKGWWGESPPAFNFIACSDSLSAHQCLILKSPDNSAAKHEYCHAPFDCTEDEQEYSFLRAKFQMCGANNDI